MSRQNHAIPDLTGVWQKSGPLGLEQIAVVETIESYKHRKYYRVVDLLLLRMSFLATYEYMVHWLQEQGFKIVQNSIRLPEWAYENNTVPTRALDQVVPTGVCAYCDQPGHAANTCLKYGPLTGRG